MNPLLKLAAWAARLLPQGFKRSLYGIKPLAKLLRGALNRAAPGGFSEVQVAAGALQGMVLSLDLHLEKDYWLGTYETDLQQAVARFIKPGQVLYDVGANIGYISLMLARQGGEKSQVFSFEALPTNVTRLQKNVALNQLQERIRVIPAAITDQPGEVSFFVHASGSMGKAAGSAGREEQYQQELRLPALSLDHFVYQQGNPPPQAVKMDIEGGEVLAMPGMVRILREARPTLFIELHGHEAARVVFNTLNQAGYKMHRMQPGYPLVNSLEELDWKAYVIGLYPA